MSLQALNHLEPPPSFSTAWLQETQTPAIENSAPALQSDLITPGEAAAHKLFLILISTLGLVSLGILLFTSTKTELLAILGAVLAGLLLRTQRKPGYFRINATFARTRTTFFGLQR